jgi:hypothetical protein
MHDVYIIPGITSDEQFSLQAQARLRDGDGFTTFHYHPYSIKGIPSTAINSSIHKDMGCKVNDPYPGHSYFKSDAGARKPGEGTCALYRNPDRAGMVVAGHCIDCHCDCDDSGELDEHEGKCPGCSR